VSTDLLQTLEVFTDLAVEHIGQGLRVLAVLYILLSVEKPIRDLVLARV